MGRAKRKPRPSMPHWYWWDVDYCWWCPKNRYKRACTGCRDLKHAVKGEPKFAKHRDRINKVRDKEARESDEKV